MSEGTEPRGREVGMSMDADGWTLGTYVTGERTSKTAVVVISDRQGWRHPPARLVADNLAEAGLVVCIPDLFRGDSWQGGDEEALGAWQSAHPADRVARDLASVVGTLKAGGAEECMAVGLGWGAPVALGACGQQGMVRAGVVAVAGGGGELPAAAAGSCVPVLVLCSSEDPEGVQAVGGIGAATATVEVLDVPREKLFDTVAERFASFTRGAS